ncbi:kinase-like domain-containing protein [Mycena olivaceomarginata]|nr:kinase-like domain-containing protein [Mycena olivaceomarginata]
MAGTPLHRSSLDLRVAGKYRLKKKIGAGSFDAVHLPYLATNVVSGEEVAIKFEPVEAKHLQLEHEYKVYKILAGGLGVPFYHAMVLDLLGDSLEKLFDRCDRKFGLKTILLLADQLISRIEYIHSRNLSTGTSSLRIRHGRWEEGERTQHHRFWSLEAGTVTLKPTCIFPYRDNKKLTGTARYTSVNTHLGVEQARRDDLESLAYMLLYFLRGSLPWQGLEAATKEEELGTFLDYTRELSFDDAPDYSYVRKLFRDIFVREGYDCDYAFDWTIARQRGTPGNQSAQSHSARRKIMNPRRAHPRFQKVATPARMKK